MAETSNRSTSDILPADRSYSSLLSPGKLIPFKTQKEFVRKLPHNCHRHHILDSYLDIEDDDELANKKDCCGCYSTMIILTGLHNETINIYSHLIPAIFILSEIVQSMMSVYHRYHTEASDFNIDSVTICNVYGISMAACFILSVYYHIGCSRMPSKYNYLLKVDLFGVFLVFMSSVLCGIHIGFYCRPWLKAIYSLLDAVIFLFVVFPVIFIPNVVGSSSSDSFWLKKVLFLVLLLLQLIPLFHWIYLYYPLLRFFWYGPLFMFGGYILGGIVWHTRFPEVLYPGKFDIFGHSHQIWHIFIVIASFSWWYALHDLCNYWHSTPCY